MIYPSYSPSCPPLPMIYPSPMDSHEMIMPLATCVGGKAHAFVLTEDHCKRFVDIFDIDRNGVPGPRVVAVSGSATIKRTRRS